VKARRLVTLFGCSVLAVSLSGCVLNAEYGEAREGAEGLIASRHHELSTRFVQTVVNAAPAVTNRKDLEEAGVTEHILLTDDEQALVAAGLRVGNTIYALDESQEHPAIDVYIYGIGSSNRGFVTATTDLFACGRLTYAAGVRDVTTVDLDCPDWLTGWRGPDAEEVSLTATMSKYPATTDQEP